MNHPYEEAMGVRRAVLGDAHVDRAKTTKTPFTHDFQDLITNTPGGACGAVLDSIAGLGRLRC
jgi:hypothetical protein